MNKETFISKKKVVNRNRLIYDPKTGKPIKQIFKIEKDPNTGKTLKLKVKNVF